MVAAAALVRLVVPVVSHFANVNAAESTPGSLPLSQCRLSLTSAGTKQPVLRSIQSPRTTRPQLPAAVRAASEHGEDISVSGSRKGAVRDQNPNLVRRQLLVGSSFITAITGLKNVSGNSASDTAIATELPENPTPSFLGPSIKGLVKLNFYLQEDPSSSFQVVEPLEGYSGNFGALYVIDQAITVSPDRNSTQVGRAKGLAVFSNNAAVGGPELVWSVDFNDSRPGGYGHSTINIRGFNDLSKEEREVSVVGGTGEFRLAQGWAIVSTYFRDPETRFATTHITVYVKIASEAETSPSSYKARK